MNAIKLYNRYTKDQLVALRRTLSDDPKNRNPPGQLYLHNAATRKKFDAIDLAITYHLADQREANGKPVSTAGYSGRKSNR